MDTHYFKLVKDLDVKNCLAVIFSPDNEDLIVSSGKLINIFDTKNFNLKCSLKEHRNYISDLRFSCCKKILASASHDNSIILWDY